MYLYSLPLPALAISIRLIPTLILPLGSPSFLRGSASHRSIWTHISFLKSGHTPTSSPVHQFTSSLANVRRPGFPCSKKCPANHIPSPLLRHLATSPLPPHVTMLRLSSRPDFLFLATCPERPIRHKTTALRNTLSALPHIGGDATSVWGGGEGRLPILGGVG